jgi:hypothetical protein
MVLSPTAGTALKKNLSSTAGGGAKGGTLSTGRTVLSPTAGAPGGSVMTLAQGALQFVIPAGYVPLPTDDREWFKQWWRRINQGAYENHANRDPGFIYADPDMLAKFIDAKYQVERCLSDVWDLAVGAGGQPLHGNERSNAEDYFGKMMQLWTRCDPIGGKAWATAPNGRTGMKLPRLYVERLPRRPLLRFEVPSTCPSESDARMMWAVPLQRNRTSGTDLLADYIREKDEKRRATEKSRNDVVADKQREVEDAQNQAAESRQVAAEMAETVQSLESSLDQVTEELDEMRRQAAGGAPVDNAALAALQAQVSTLASQLSTSNAELSEARRAAELAEEAAELESESLEASFLQTHKWHLAIAGLAAAGAGLWYYYFKYKPAQAAAPAPVANPDEEPVYDVRGRMIGAFWQSAVPGRWVARSSVMQRPLFSAESPERAIEWIEDVADRAR